MANRLFEGLIWSKTPAAMANEVLCKLVCHNLVVLIHEMYELGIDPGFGGLRPDAAGADEPRMIRFPGVG